MFIEHFLIISDFLFEKNCNDIMNILPFILIIKIVLLVLSDLDFKVMIKCIKFINAELIKSTKGGLSLTEIKLKP